MRDIVEEDFICDVVSEFFNTSRDYFVSTDIFWVDPMPEGPRIGVDVLHHQVGVQTSASFISNFDVADEMLLPLAVIISRRARSDVVIGDYRAQEVGDGYDFLVVHQDGSISAASDASDGDILEVKIRNTYKSIREL